jgi:PAS domain S-box-containing protein
MRDSETSGDRRLEEKAESLKSGGERASTVHAARAAGHVNKVAASISRAGEIAMKRHGSSNGARVCAYIGGGIVLLWFCSLLNEVLDLPHLTLAMPRTPVNWGEVVIESVVVVCTVGLVFFMCRRIVREGRMAEQSLRESEERFRRLYEQAPLGYQSLDAEGCFIDVNQAWLDLLGYSREQVIGHWFGDFLAPQEVDAFKQRFSRFKATGEVHVDVEMIQSAGSTIIVHIDGRIGHDEHGQFKQTHCILHDITERKKAEERLKAERQRLYDVLETLPVMVCLLTPDYHVTFANRVFRQKFGEDNGRCCYDYIFGLKGPCEFCEAYNVLKTGKPHHWECTSPDGCSIIDVYDFPFTDTDGTPLILEMDIDITERKRVEGALRESEARYRELANSITDVFFAMDENLRYTYWNRASEELTGIPAKDAIGKSLYEVFPDTPETREAQEAYLNVLRTQQPQTFENEYRLGDKDFVFEISVYPSIRGLSVFTRDISERKKAEEEIKNLAKFPEENSNPVYRVSKDGVLLYANPASRRLVLEDQTKIGDKIPEKWIGMIKNAYDSGKKQQAELELSGRVFLFDLIPVIEDGYVNSYATDITERKKAEEALETEHKRFLSMFDGIDEVVYVADPTTHEILYMNEPAKRQWGDAVGQKCHSVLRGRDAPCSFCNNDKIFGERVGQSDIWEFQNEVNRRWYRCIDKAIRWPDGRMVRFELALDITEGKQAERELLDYQTRLKRLSSELMLAEESERRRIAVGVHDQIGQRMALLKMGTESLKESVSEPDILAALNRTCDLIDEVVEDVHSLTFELSNPVLYEVGLNAAVDSWLSRYVDSSAGLRYRIVSEPDPLKPEMQTSVFLFGVIQELLTNVMKHAKATYVEVNMRERKDEIEVSVKDNGVGFDPSKLDLSVKQTGGFGLFDARERVKYLHGDLAIDSKPGRGTQVRLKVPKGAR